MSCSSSTRRSAAALRARATAALVCAFVPGIIGIIGIAESARAQSLVRAAQAAGPSVTAHLECEPARAAIGEPVECILTVDHPRDVTVKMPEKAPAADDAWATVGDRRIVDVLPTAGSETLRTRVTWRVMSLEPGSRTLPALEIKYEDREGTHTLTTAPIVLEVQGELGPDEDQARPLKGFHPPPVGSGAALHWPWIVGLVVLVCAISAWIFRRLRKQPTPLPRATALDRMVELERAIAADPSAGRAVTYSVSMLVRDSVDAFVREARVGLPDSDWIERIEKDERVPLGVRSASARILRESEQVKYALQVPTRFAVEEMLRDARNALEALASTPPPEPTSAESPRSSDKEAA